MKNIFKLQKSSSQERHRFDVHNLNHSTEYKKEEKIEPVSSYLDEGNPNTQQKIDEAHGQDPNHSASSSQPERTGTVLHTDQQLREEIKKAIDQEETVALDDRQNIQVSVQEKTVTLTGTVASQQQKMTVGNKAVAFVGPDKVVNQLNVMQK